MGDFFGLDKKRGGKPCQGQRKLEVGQGVGGQRGKSSVLGGAPGACCQGLNELQPPGKGRAASTETSGCESLLSMYSCCQIGKEDLGKNGIKNIAESIIMPAHKSGLQSCLEQCVRS